MNLIFFDTETNGLPKNWRASMSNVDNWPRVIQLSWLVADEHENILRKQNHIIYPDGWKVPEEKFWIDNGNNTGKCMVRGIPMNVAIDLFLWDYKDCDAMISHNMEFDFNVLGAEMLRYGKKTDKRATRLCTKELTTDLCKIPFGNDRRPWMNKNYKWPSLAELHNFLFNKPFEGAHDAWNDVIALHDCFFELVKRNVIALKVQPV